MIDIGDNRVMVNGQLYWSNQFVVEQTTRLQEANAKIKRLEEDQRITKAFQQSYGEAFGSIEREVAVTIQHHAINFKDTGSIAQNAILVMNELSSRLNKAYGNAACANPYYSQLYESTRKGFEKLGHNGVVFSNLFRWAHQTIDRLVTALDISERLVSGKDENIKDLVKQIAEKANTIADLQVLTLNKENLMLQPKIQELQEVNQRLHTELDSVKKERDKLRRQIKEALPQLVCESDYYKLGNTVDETLKDLGWTSSSGNQEERAASLIRAIAHEFTIKRIKCVKLGAEIDFLKHKIKGLDNTIEGMKVDAIRYNANHVDKLESDLKAIRGGMSEVMFNKDREHAEQINDYKHKIEQLEEANKYLSQGIQVQRNDDDSVTIQFPKRTKDEEENL